MRLSKILDHILLGGYEAAKEEATRQVVARYSRRNISAQNGYFIDQKGLQLLHKAGDKAMRNIRNWRQSLNADH